MSPSQPSALGRPPISGPVVSADPSGQFPPWEPSRSVVSGEPGSKEDEVRLSLRIVIHLDQTGPPGDGGVAKRESTQQGMAQVLSVTQGAVSKVLSRLVAAEVVRHERHHVRGEDRRVRVYFLTARGEELAREIQYRFGLPSRVPLRGQTA